MTAFRPTSVTAKLSVSGVSARAPIDPAAASVRILCWADDNLPFIAFGDANVVATLGNMPLLPKSVEVFHTPPAATHMAYIANAGTGIDLFVTSGEGD